MSNAREQDHAAAPENTSRRLGWALRIGLVGLGYWGQNYLRLIEQSPQTELAAVCDTSEEMLAYSAEVAPRARRSREPLDVIEAPDVDAVVIATPATTHYPLVLSALQAGKHVLCEKPLTMSVSDCEHLIEVADCEGVTLFVGHTFVYNAAIRALRSLAANASLGNTLHAHAVWAAPGPVRRDVNALWDLAPHPVSILMYVLGRVPVSVSAGGQAILEPGREDISFIRLHYDEAMSADVQLSWLAPRKVRTLTITGEHRIAIFDDMTAKDKLQIFDTAFVNGKQPHGATTRKITLPAVPVHVPDIPNVEPLGAQLDHFLDCCRRELTPESDGMAGTKVVRLLEAADSSLRAGGHVVALEDLVAHR